MSNCRIAETGKNNEVFVVSDADRTAIVIGVTGRVGSLLADSLLEHGWKVQGAARCSGAGQKEALAEKGIDVIPFDVLKDDPAALPDADVVFLEIWDPSQPLNIWPINFYGVGRIVERYAGKADFVNGCSSAVYGEHLQPNSETGTPPSPTTEYGRSRYCQERLIDYFCVTRGSRGIYLRYMHANSVKRGYVRRTAEKIIKGESIGDDPDARIQVIGIEDTVRMTRMAADRVDNPPEVVNCCHPRSWTKRELAEALLKKLGRGEVVFDVGTGGVEKSRYADTTKMVEWFGEPEVPVQTILDRVVEDINS